MGFLGQCIRRVVGRLSLPLVLSATALGIAIAAYAGGVQSSAATRAAAAPTVVFRTTEFTVSSDDTGSGLAECPSGYAVIGGGYAAVHGGVGEFHVIGDAPNRHGDFYGVAIQVPPALPLQTGIPRQTITIRIVAYCARKGHPVIFG